MLSKKHRISFENKYYFGYNITNRNWGSTMIEELNFILNNMNCDELRKVASNLKLDRIYIEKMQIVWYNNTYKIFLYK